MAYINSYPLSPISPSSSPLDSKLPLPLPISSPIIDDNRRRSKRDSTASSSRRREREEQEQQQQQQAASRYPSPPPTGNYNSPTRSSGSGSGSGGSGGGSGRRNQGIESSLQIPPYNPNSNKRVSNPTTSSSNSNSSSTIIMNEMIIPPYQPQSSNQSQSQSQTSNQMSQAQKQLLIQQRLAQNQLNYSQNSPNSNDRSLPPLPPGNNQQQQQQQQRIPPPPSQSQSYSNRPVSTTIIPQQMNSPPPASSNNNKVRQSVGYLPTSASSSASSPLINPLTSLGPHPQLYTPHQMPRQKIYFGPYILLQTLGEGEFGKVKLGVHSERWGEEVAIKLIKRGNVDTLQRGEKVRREIEVLKAVRHPNIVRLYDVIETEKYIGIVLEYASGGELFDHILAHRYLKERDASRLFAQLISGVAYLHAKHIVHRDLKLENLLLDRNRNVIITDFGFANKFELASDDLMATSCGSPCYAAPELVVQEGKYVGTAVDVWSCGVILYAMLAGYLPYDDDPANPEGDNINLLYKYIMNTPLTFPDWITEEPRNLLLKMLVPDPIYRCTIDQVKQHSWLNNFGTTFNKSVGELEAQAQDAELWKREALEAQRQFLILQQQAQLMAAQQGANNNGANGSGMNSMQAQAMTRSQSTAATRHRSAIVTSSNNLPPPLPHQQHHQQQQQQSQQQSQHQQQLMDYKIPASVPEESDSRIASPSRIIPIPNTTSSPTPSSIYQPPSNSSNSRRNSTLAPPTSPTIQSHPITVDADPFSYDLNSSKRNSIPISTPMISSLSAPANGASISNTINYGAGEDQTMAEGIKRGESRRKHGEMLPPTIPSGNTSAVVPSSPTSSSSRHNRRSSVKSNNPNNSGTSSSSSSNSREVAAAIESERRKKSHRATVQVEYDGGSDRLKGKEVISEDVVMIADGNKNSLDLISFESPSPINANRMESASTGSSTPPLVPIVFPSTPPRESTLASSPSSETPRKRKSTGSPQVQQMKENISTPPPPLPVSPINNATPAIEFSPKTIEKDVPNSPGNFSLNSNNGEVKPPTHKKGKSIDRFSIRNILGGGSGTSGGVGLERTQSQNGRRSSTSERSKTVEAIQLAKAEALEKEKALEELTNNRRQSRRQKAMSLQPFKTGTNSSKLTRTPKLESGETFASITMPRTRSSTAVVNQGMLPPPRPSAGVTNSRILPTSATTTNTFSDAEATWNSTQSGSTPSGKAKAVMDWFRRRSTRGMPNAEVPPSPNSTNSTATFEKRLSVLPSIPSSSFISESSLPQLPPSSPLLSSTVMAKAPSVIVTAAIAPEPERYAIDAPGERSVPASRTASGAQSHLSQMSAMTTSTVATTASNSTSTIHATSLGASFTNAKLRFHQGALDKSAITSKSPQVVIIEIRNALWNMGIDVVQEGEFKLKCIRKSRKKAFATIGMAKSSSQHSNLNASTSSISRPMSNSIPPSPSTSSGFRSFFGRKNSTTPAGSPLPTSSPMINSPTMDSFDPSHSPLYATNSRFSNTSQPLPTYGDSESGDEVRFYVEITSVKNLEGLYSIDQSRMKGNAFAYKHVRDTLLSNLELSTA